MTHIDFKRDKGSFIFDIKGHSGDDCVCAGCSTLAYTLLNAVLRMEHHGQLAKRPVYKDDPKKGSFYIRFAPSNRSRAAAAAIAYTVYDGFRLLSEEHPANVKISG